MECQIKITCATDRELFALLLKASYTAYYHSLIETEFDKRAEIINLTHL